MKSGVHLNRRVYCSDNWIGKYSKMKRFLKPLIALSVVTALTLSVVICCCAMKVVHTSLMKSMGKTASGSCQQCDSSSAKKFDCRGYCFLKASPNENLRVFTVAASSLQSFSHFQDTTTVAFKRDIYQLSSLAKTSYGNMFFSRVESVPLYIQIRNLRL